MILLVDIGNTNLRWALSDGTTLGPMHPVRHGGAAPLDLLAAWERLEAPARVVVGSVAAASVTAAIGRVARAYWGLEPEQVATRPAFGDLRVAYPDPSRLGVDRWLAMIGARLASPEATLILDAGTAVTFDLLLADGRHLGGLILPGVEMQRASLLAGTGIPRIGAEPTDALWATDTGTAVAAGSLQGIGALTTRLFDRLSREAGATPRLILTGGDAERLMPAMDRPYDWVPDLVLQGLGRVATGDVEAAGR